VPEGEIVESLLLRVEKWLFSMLIVTFFSSLVIDISVLSSLTNLNFLGETGKGC
jgi:hypothetical protein